MEREQFIESPAKALAEYYRYGSASGYKGAHYACAKDTFQVPFDPVKSIYWYKKVMKEGNDYESQEAKELLEPYMSKTNNDAEISYNMTKSEVEATEDDAKYMYQCVMWSGCPYATLAWHYYYGIGCNKNIEEAKKLIKWACTEKGEYWYPAYKKLIRDMGLDSELKFNPKLNEEE